MIQWESRLSTPRCSPFNPAPPMHAARQVHDGGITITGQVSKEPHRTYCVVCWNYLNAVTALYGASSTPRPVSKLRYFLCPMCREALSLPTYREGEIHAGRPIAHAITIDYRRRWNSACSTTVHPLVKETGGIKALPSTGSFA